ncbi:hypothetical protein [Streptomyces sp. HPF1205]|uniref:hypothetical protein n=1 Tax=Streptomyces sp. HPF1205 TaxID=2873262 RepID=UPI001CED15C0|nr:hypothetical protein [Streptomyces sp. HPF1205]
MTIENSPTEPTEPVAAAPKGGTAKPNNQYQDIIATDVTAEGAATTTTTKSGGAQPDNQYQDSAPKG